jgi:hypothetical protein
MQSVPHHIGKAAHTHEAVERARSDRDIPILRIVYTRMSTIVSKYIAPVLKDLPTGRVWLRQMYAELHHMVPFTMLLDSALRTPFGVNCGVPYRVVVDDVGVDMGVAALLELVKMAHSHFRSFPRATQTKLLKSRVVTLARHRLANIEYLCECLRKS